MYEDIIHQGNLKEAKTAVTVYIDEGEQVSVIPVGRKKTSKPNYFMIGNGTMNKHKIYGIDFLQEVVNSSSAEQFLLLAIKNGINYSNAYTHIVKVVGETSTQKQYIKAGYKSLKERGLVKRVKKSYYMINPNALIPPNYEQALEDWEGIES